MDVQCRGCWTVFDASLAEREPGTRKILCPPCADCGDSVVPREEWTEREVAEVSRSLRLPYTFHLLVDGCIEEIDVPAVSEEEAWKGARKVQADLYGGAGELRLWV